MSTAATTTTQANGAIRLLPPRVIVVHNNKNQNSMAETAKVVSDKVVEGSCVLVNTGLKTAGQFGVLPI